MASDSMYPEGDEPQSTGQTPATDEQRKHEDEDVGGTLVPKSFFDGDVEPGHRCEVEVVHVYDDEVEIKYTKPGEEKKPQSQMDQADGAIDKMASMSEATAGA